MPAAVVETQVGRQDLVYCDFGASGRADPSVEHYMTTQVLPFFANTHSESSLCGQRTGQLREQSRELIRSTVGASDSHCVMFAGSGTTGAMDLLVRMLAHEFASQRVEVFIGPYEHHSNDLPWRASAWPVMRCGLDARGHLDLDQLRLQLEASGADLKLVSISAASNVTGIITDTEQVARICSEAGAHLILDCAASAPYLPLSVQIGEYPVAAMLWSPHKFYGGPGASGVLVVKREWVPTVPVVNGGGTVVFVSASEHHYVGNLERLHEAGTPNIVGDIRSGLVLQKKGQWQADSLQKRSLALSEKMRSRLSTVDGLFILGPTEGNFLPTVSFNLYVGEALISYSLVVTLLSDLYGIQARGGCSCAGPYAHELLDIDEHQSRQLARQMVGGEVGQRPGWVRVSLSPTMDAEEVEFVLAAIEQLAAFGNDAPWGYQSDGSGNWRDPKWARSLPPAFGESAHLSDTVTTLSSYDARLDAAQHWLITRAAQARLDIRHSA